MVKLHLVEELSACLVIGLFLMNLLLHQVVALFVFIEGDVAILAELSEGYKRFEAVSKSDWIVRHA